MLKKLGGDQQREEPGQPQPSESVQAYGGPPVHVQDPSLIMKQIKRMSREGRREARLSGGQSVSTVRSPTPSQDPVDDGMSPTSQHHQDGELLSSMTYEPRAGGQWQHIHQAHMT